jgi:hypothetical protein
MVGLMKGKKGGKLQERVWRELRGKLEGVRVGDTNLV